MKSLIRLLLPVLSISACGNEPPPDRVRVSGQVEATDVQLSSQVGGRLLDLHAAEGDRVMPGALIARLDVADTELALARARADLAGADAQLRLLAAGSRPEDIRQAEAEVAAADSAVAAIEVELMSAQTDVERFEMLLAQNSGSRKQRDDAVARRDLARRRLEGAQQQVRAAREAVARLRAGARREEIEAARARVAAVKAQIAVHEKAIADATITAPVGGIVTEKLANVGELLQPRSPIVVVTDLDHAWADVYVDEPIVPRLRLGQEATLFTDAGGPGIRGTVSYVSEKAEFTPRNVQTADERSRLVYRVKVSVDNTNGVLKAGMPVEADIPLQP
jgi:HlyD family secretion protein